MAKGRGWQRPCEEPRQGGCHVQTLWGGRMNRKKISECLKQDISKLVDIALGMAGTREKHDQIITLQQCIYAGLGDYELAWRAEVKRVADSVQEGTGEEE